jgi:hypothetical protein
MSECELLMDYIQSESTAITAIETLTPPYYDPDDSKLMMKMATHILIDRSMRVGIGEVTWKYSYNED